jgi:hypothetical protein
MSQLEPLERGVIEKLLEGDDETLAKLRRQFEKAVVVKREMSGVGFYTTLAVKEGVYRIDDRSFIFGDVIAEIPGLENGAGFLLYVRDGLLDCLEGYTYGDERWPQQLTGFMLRYEKAGQRDLTGLSE